MPTLPPRRLAYIDWMRGLACVLMFQTHCYDSWLSAGARRTTFFMWSQLGGTLPAPLFLFLSGISFALVTDKLQKKGTPPNVIARTTIRRGAEILGLGLLFRVQEYVIAWGWAPWSDLLRVDILNTIGISMILMGVVCWIVLKAGRTSRIRQVLGLTAGGVALLISLLTPLLWTTWRPHWLPWPIESYIDGVHTFNAPQPWLFPIFPWIAFALAGLAVGLFLFTDFAKRDERITFGVLGAGGVLCCGAAIVLDLLPMRLYAVYDYWHTSPLFLLLRCGILLMIMFLAYVWCKWGLASNGLSPAIQLGKTSLLVYWVHIEFVYGRFSILPKRQCSVGKASVGLLVIFVAMLLLSIARTNWKRKKVVAIAAPGVPIANVGGAV